MNKELLDKCKNYFNSVNVDVKVISKPRFISKYDDVRVFRIRVACKRESGRVDEFYVNYTDKYKIYLKEGMFINVSGELRTLNDPKNQLIIESFVFADRLTVLDGEPKKYTNECKLEGCDLVGSKKMRYGQNGKEILTYRVKVKNTHGRVYFVRCTSWGKDAIFVDSLTDTTKCKLTVWGRLEGFTGRSEKPMVCLAVYSVDAKDVLY